MSVRAFVGIGSNLDDPIGHVRRALRELDEVVDSQCVAASSLYRSDPMGPPGQPDYINAVAALDTDLSPLDLLHALQALEQTHGRVREGLRWGPRTLDLDLLLYGSQTIDLPELQVPHPGLHERAFVLYPLAEIEPQLVVPGKGTMEQLMVRCHFQGLSRL